MNLIERIKIWLGWKKVVILIVDPLRGVVNKHWAHGSDKYMVRTGNYDLFIDYNNEKVEVRKTRSNHETQERLASGRM
jgi:hypothetical protein